MYISIHICTPQLLNRYINTDTYIYIYIFEYIFIYIYIFMYTFIYVYTFSKKEIRKEGMKE